jgi:hypothetical protein
MNFDKKRLFKYGITEEELKEALGTALKESHSEAEQNDTQDSGEFMEEILDDMDIGRNFLENSNV